MTQVAEYKAGPLTRNAGKNLLIALLLILVTVVVVVVATKVFWVRDLVSSSFTEPLGGLQRIETYINFGRGSLTIDALPAGATELIEATFETPDEAAEIALDRSGAEGVLTFGREEGEEGEEDSPMHAWRDTWRNPPAEWAIHLSSEPIMSLFFKSIRSDYTTKLGPENRVWLDLRGLQVPRLYGGIDGAEVTIYTPSNAGHVDMNLGVNTRNMLIVIPEGVAGRINKYQSTGYQIDVDTQRFPPRVGSDRGSHSGAAGAVYESPGFETAVNRVSIDLFVGTGSVSIR